MFPNIPKYVAFGKQDGTVNIYDFYTKRLKYNFGLIYPANNIISFSDDLLVYSNNGFIFFYKWREKVYIKQILKNPKTIYLQKVCDQNGYYNTNKDFKIDDKYLHCLFENGTIGNKLYKDENVVFTKIKSDENKFQKKYLRFLFAHSDSRRYEYFCDEDNNVNILENGKLILSENKKYKPVWKNYISTITILDPLTEDIELFRKEFMENVHNINIRICDPLINIVSSYMV